MRTMLRSKVTLLFMSLGLLLACAGVALADTIVVDGDVLNTSNSANTTFTLCPGVGGSVDQKATINFQGGSHFANGATVNITAGVESGAQDFITATGASVVTGTATNAWNNSSDSVSTGNLPLTVDTDWAAGTYDVTYTATGAKAGGGTLTLTDTSKITISQATSGCQAPNEAPVVNVVGPEDGAEYEFGNVPAASCTVDDEDADASAEPQVNPSGLNSYGLGSETVTCSYTDSGDETGTDTVTYTIVDTTDPVVADHDPVIEEAAGPNGAAVNYTNPTANDAVYGSVDVSCDPPSGSEFPLGETTVTCSATDGSNNTGTNSFTVTVRDTTPPALTLPADITEEATGPSGAAVNFTASAEDLVDGNVAVNCDADSGDTFALGTTEVSCSATDAAGNTSNGSFNVTVQDTTGPALTLPANITTTATSNSQATVNFTATANDLVDGSRPVSCNPTSGFSFPAGTTTVNCSSTDSRGNTSEGSFTVTVNYNWTGFFQPVDNPGTFNKVKIGSTVPVKFSLGGNQGLNIFAPGYPQVSKPIACGANPAVDSLEEYAPTGTNSGLKYDATANQYIYNWKTDGYKAGECRALIVKLADGTVKTANFTFFK